MMKKLLHKTTISLFVVIGCLMPVAIYAQTTVTIDNMVYTIDNGAAILTGFTGDRPVGDVVIPTEITHNNATYKVASIGGRTFERCRGMTSVSIPNGITLIGDSAFMVAAA